MTTQKNRKGRGLAAPTLPIFKKSRYFLHRIFDILVFFSKIYVFIFIKHLEYYLSMGFMNLLKANYTGKVGQTVGAEWKGKPVIKKAVFVKSPPTQSQTNNVRAFECLNRIASATAKLGWQRLALDTRKMLPHNAIASWWKPAIEDHVFNPAAISRVIPQDGSIIINKFAYDPAIDRVSIVLDLDQGYAPPYGSLLYILCFNEVGKVFMRVLTIAQPYNSSWNILYSTEFTYFLMGFIVEPPFSRPNIHGFFIQEGLSMQYSLAEQQTKDFWIDGKPIFQQSFNGTMTLSSANGRMEGSQLLLSGVDTVIKSDFSWSVNPTRNYWSCTPTSYSLPDGTTQNFMAFQEHIRLTKSPQGELSIYAYFASSTQVRGSAFNGTIWYTKL